MSQLLRTLFIVLIIIALGFWFFTMFRSCSEQNEGPVLENVTVEDDNEEANTANLDDLFEDEEADGEAEGEAEGEADGEGDGLDEDNGGETISDVETGEEDDLEKEDEEADQLDIKTSGLTSGMMGNRYMVVAGAYLSEGNAEANVRALKRKGFDEAEVVTFDFSEYHTVCVGRFESLREARSLENKLARSGVESYVHRRRGKRAN